MSREAETSRPFLEKNHAHELKCYPGEFEAIDSGRKTCELRRDDCGYMVGHRLLLREFDSETGYSGRWLFVTVEHIIRAWDRAGMEGGYVVMSIKPGRFEGEPPFDRAPKTTTALEYLRDMVEKLSREATIEQCALIEQRTQFRKAITDELGLSDATRADILNAIRELRAERDAAVATLRDNEPPLDQAPAPVLADLLKEIWSEGLEVSLSSPPPDEFRASVWEALGRTHPGMEGPYVMSDRDLLKAIRELWSSNTEAATQLQERDEALREHDEALVGLAGYARDILKLEKSLEDMERKLQEARAELEAMTLDRDDARVGRSRAWAARDLAREGRNLAQDGCLAREEERDVARAECLRLRSVRAELERLVGSL